VRGGAASGELAEVLSFPDADAVTPHDAVPQFLPNKNPLAHLGREGMTHPSWFHPRSALSSLRRRALSLADNGGRPRLSTWAR